MKKLTLLLFFSSIMMVLAGSLQRAQWIHYPEADEEGLNKPRFFWTDIIVPRDVVSAEIVYHLDDYGNILIDGRRLEVRKQTPVTEKKPALLFDDIRLLPPGRHRVEFRDINGGASGGICCKITLRHRNGTLTEIFSDETWFTAKTESGQGGEAEAVHALSHGDATILPFGAYFESLYLLSAEEIGQITKGFAEKRAKFRRFADEILAKEPTEPAKITFINGRPEIQIGDVHLPPILYSVHHYQDFNNSKFTRSF